MASFVLTFDSSSAKFAAQTIGSAQITPGGVLSASIGSGQVGGIHLANQSLVSANYGSGQIASAHLASSFIGNITAVATITSGQIVSGLIGNGAVNSGNIASGSIGGFHLAPAVLAPIKLASWDATTAEKAAARESGGLVCLGSDDSAEFAAVDAIATAAGHRQVQMLGRSFRLGANVTLNNHFFGHSEVFVQVDDPFGITCHEPGNITDCWLNTYTRTDAKHVLTLEGIAGTWYNYRVGLLDKLKIRNQIDNMTGRGLLLNGEGTASGAGFITLSHFGAIAVQGFEYGVDIYSTEAGGNEGFVTGNIFDSLALRNARDLNINVGVEAAENTGNIFKAVQMQKLISGQVVGIDLGPSYKNSYNRFLSVQGWDWYAAGVPVLRLGSGVTRTYVRGDLSLEVQDNSGNDTNDIVDIASDSALASGSVRSGHIGNAAVNSGNISSGAVGGVHIANQSIVSSDIGTNVIGGIHVFNQSLISANFGSGQIASAHIASSFIGNLTLTLTSGQVQSGIIGNNAVNSGNVASGSIAGVHLANQSLVSAHIGSGIVGIPHLAPWLSGQIIVGQGVPGTPITKDQFVGIEYVIDGGGSVITSGRYGSLEIPFPCTLARITLLADQSGYAYPNIWLQPALSSLIPSTSSQTLTSNFPPNISGGLVRYQETSLSGWMKTIASGDVLDFAMNSPTSNITRLTISLGAYR